jgi:hypothetical protein
MSKQTRAYLEDMQKMYEIIMRKCINNGELTNLDKLFLETYKRTIKTEILSVGCATAVDINKK